MLRVLGLILVLIGGLTLGYRGFESRISTVAVPEAAPMEVANEPEPWWRLSAVTGGIALVGGLLLLASSPRREDS